MKFICKNEILSKVIQNAERVTGKNLTLPILSNILLQTKEDYLLVRSTNLNIGLEYKINVKVIEEGSVCVKGDIFSSLLSSIPKKENIEIEEVDDFIKIKSKQHEVNIKTSKNEDFPTIPYTQGDSFKIEIDKLLKAINSVSFSSSVSDIKPEISSVFMYSNNGYVYSVSTDSFRLAERKTQVKNIPENLNIIIPIKNCIDLVKILSNEEGSVNVTFTNNQLSIKNDDLYITTRVVDGTYPDYKQIVPKEVKTTVIALKNELLEAFKLGSVVSDKFNQVIFNINPTEKVFNIKTKNNDTGESCIEIDSTIKGNPIEVSYNLRYLTDCLNVIQSDSVCFEFLEANRPLVVKGVGDETFMSLIMPMNR